MSTETCQVAAGPVAVKWPALVEGRAGLVKTEVHFAAPMLQIGVPHIICFFKTTLTGVLLRFGNGVPRVLTERPSYNRIPAQDSCSVPSKNEKYDT